MKALAFKISQNTYCCACAEQLARISGSPHLFFSLYKPKRVNAEAVCSRCGYWYGSHDASCAADRISTMLNDERGA